MKVVIEKQKLGATKMDIKKYKQYIVDIKGRKYLTVAGRISMFWDSLEKGQFGSIETEVKEQGDTILAKAIAKIGNRTGTGHASEVIGDSTINKTSALENCETSAIGRALGTLGFGLLEAGGIASADEVTNAEFKAGRKSPPVTDKQKKFIEKLWSQKGKIPDDPFSFFDKLSVYQAKLEIDRLLKLATVNEGDAGSFNDGDFSNTPEARADWKEEERVDRNQ